MAVFTIASDGVCTAVTVSVSVGELTALPPNVPEAKATFVIEPAARSNGVTVRCEVHVVDAPGSRSPAGQIAPGGSSSAADDSLTLLITTLENEMVFELSEVSITATSRALSFDAAFAGAAGAGQLEFEFEDSDAFPEFGEGFRNTRSAIGRDVTASRVGLNSSGSGDDFHYYGTSGGIRAFSIASTACNIGDQTAEWISGGSGRHPVIGQNMFRLLNGRFEHIGQSWLKHSFCAVSEFTCGSCQPTNCSTLGVGCADTYWATLNDGGSGGPKSRINPQGVSGHGGTHNNHNYPSPTGPGAIRGRLQISDADILAGGQNFAEIHYVTHDEDLDQRHNNASWREVNLSLTNISGVESGQESVHFMQPAIIAWRIHGDGVFTTTLQVPGEGRFYLLSKASDNGNGTWHYEYAIQNLNSDRSGGSFIVPVPERVTVTNVGFHDVDSHSGEPYDTTDWPGVIEEGACVWSTLTHDQNVSANALRWGTLYNFRFDANSPPTTATATLGLFKPGDPSFVTATVPAPAPLSACVGDLDGSGAVGAADLAILLGSWGPNPGHPADLDGDGDVGGEDLAILLGAWGPCP